MLNRFFYPSLVAWLAGLSKKMNPHLGINSWFNVDHGPMFHTMMCLGRKHSLHEKMSFFFLFNGDSYSWWYRDVVVKLADS